MALFKCAVCDEKSARIKDLLDQVEMLRKMAFPGGSETELSLRDREMDRIMSGNDEPIEIHESEEAKEAMSILMGSYANSQTDVM